MLQIINNVTITITYSNGCSLTKTISETWEAGKTYNYKISYSPRTFDYTGNIQMYTVPVTGTYKLEVYGAQGRDGGGYGGYSWGNIKLIQGNILYICIGGADIYKTFKGFFSPCNTYNGGGIGDAAGGGATHISTTNRGELKNFASYQNDVVIVAGGGGGLEWAGKGGDGGGLNGSNGNSTESWSATGGTQTAGGTSIGPVTLVNGDFGQGGYGYNSDIDYGAGGGGGWYGGGGTSYAGAGGGGSGHLGTSLITGTTGMSNGIRFGNGYARITFVSAN